jgi:glycosyltransferase involved in cell wall biosynthesis
MIEVQPNPLDTGHWHTSRNPEKPRQIVAMVGTLYPLKRVDLGIDAVAKLNDYMSTELRLIGGGPERIALESQAKARGVDARVVFFGSIGNVRDILAGCSALWLLSEREGLPMAALEAMALGLPVIGADVPGVRDLVVNGRNGILVPFGDATAVAVATERLWRDPTLYFSLSEGAKRTAERFGVEIIADQHVARYRRAIEARQAARENL